MGCAIQTSIVRVNNRTRELFVKSKSSPASTLLIDISHKRAAHVQTPCCADPTAGRLSRHSAFGRC